MQRFLGSVFIILSCSGLGFEKANELNRHVKQLEELKKIFTMLQSELRYHKISFSELFDIVSQKTDGIFRKWMQTLSENLSGHGNGTFQDIWIQSIEESFQYSGLKKEEIEELKCLGTSLGYLESIGLYLEQLEIMIQNARNETIHLKKLYQSIGILGGIFLVIILL